MSTSGGASGSTFLRWGFLAAALVLGIGYARHQFAEAAKRAASEKAAAQVYAAAHPPTRPAPAAAHPLTPQAPAVEGECTTPCVLRVGWGTVMKTGGRPVLIKYQGKTEWIRTSGREDDKITLDQFSPGETQFASPDSTPVLVQIYAAAHPAPPPEGECTTPCTLRVGWGQPIKSGGLPVLIKFQGKTEWLRLSGRDSERITLDQFSPGEAQFASPNSTPVLVQVYPAR